MVETTLERFKTDLTAAIHRFIYKEGFIGLRDETDLINLYLANKIPSEINKKYVSDLNSMITNATNAIDLRSGIENYLLKMYYRICYIFPAAHPLKKEIILVLKKPEYQLLNLLVEENRDLRSSIHTIEQHSTQQSIKQLQEEIINLRKQVEEFEKSQQTLEEAVQQRTKHLQEKIIELEEKNKILTQQLETAQNEKNALSLEVLQKNQEIERLKEKLPAAINPTSDEYTHRKFIPGGLFN